MISSMSSLSAPTTQAVLPATEVERQATRFHPAPPRAAPRPLGTADALVQPVVPKAPMPTLSTPELLTTFIAMLPDRPQGLVNWLLAKRHEDLGTLAEAFVTIHAVPREFLLFGNPIGDAAVSALEQDGLLSPAELVACLGAAAEESFRPWQKSRVTDKCALLDSAGTLLSVHWGRAVWDDAALLAGVANFRDRARQAMSSLPPTTPGGCMVESEVPAMQLGALGGILLSGAYQAAQGRGFKQRQEIVDKARALFFELVGFSHPPGVFPVGRVGTVLDLFFSEAEGGPGMLAVRDANAKMPSRAPSGLWSDQAWTAFECALETTIQANGLG